ncbi:MAG: hypothetical protein AABX38_01545 [Candidatus Micrarchaeota archaeon]
MKLKLIFLALVFSILLLIFGCVQTIPLEKGTLNGRITIGPICPVERYPPDPRCQPTNETYKAWQLYVWNLDQTTKIAIIKPELSGSYNLQLPVGKYLIDLEKQNQRFGAGNLPATIEIKPNQTTNLDIDIDTGIR